MILTASRLAGLRAALAASNLDAFLVPRSDEYLGEYVAPSGERLAWLSGFTGSAGLAIVTATRAVLFTDGRYTTQAAAQTDPACWELRHLIEEPPAEWLRHNAAGQRVGFDPWLHGVAALGRFAAAGVELVAVPANPIDALWDDRPAPPAAAPFAHEGGEPAAAKREALGAALRQAGEAACLLTDPHSVAWLLNLRGGDLAHTPLTLAFAVLAADGGVRLFLHVPQRVDAALRATLGPQVSVEDREALPAALARFGGRKVRLDPEVTPARLADLLRAAGAEIVEGEDPCRLPRACKNAAERQGARDAHAKDALAVARFLAWFAREAPRGALTELTAAEALLRFRRAVPGFVAESFPAISGAGENGAIVHYRATTGSERRIHPDECYLIDSGGQYPEGTTDITRTLWTGPGPAPASLRARYTAVLRGHVALATLRFPEGVAGPHIDAVARRPIWELGLDYDHGTGHGVGSFLSVHEGPVSISRAAKVVPIRAGMILSDEPGYYLPGQYGMRIENLLLAREAGREPDQVKPFLDFETLTLAPYCRALIEPSLLTPSERAWVDAYHQRLRDALAPHLDPETAAWLRAETAKLP